jgi:hypothetical protein
MGLHFNIFFSFSFSKSSAFHLIFLFTHTQDDIAHKVHSGV